MSPSACKPEPPRQSGLFNPPSLANRTRWPIECTAGLLYGEGNPMTMDSTPHQDLETLWIETPEVRLHVRRGGARRAQNPGAAPLLFVHGYPDSWRSWIPMMTELGSDHEVAALDLRGAGRSSAPADQKGFAIERVLPDFVAVIDRLVGPKGQVHLVCHDWGATLGWAFASVPEYQARLRSLTAIAGPHPELVLPLMARRLRSLRPAALRFVCNQLLRSWYIFAFQIPGLGEALWRKNPRLGLIRAHQRGGVPRSLAEACIDPDTLVADTIGLLGLYRQLLRGLGRRRRAAAKHSPLQIDVPSLMIVPRQDFALSPLLYDNLPEHVRELELRYIDANHWAHLQYPTLVNGLVRTHVERNQSPSAGTT